MKTILRISTYILIGISTACGPVPNAAIVDVPSGPNAWIDAPLDHSTIPQAEYQVVSHASDPGGLSEFELKVNGQIVSINPVQPDQTGQTLVYISQPWLPPAPGVYFLEVRAANSDGDYGPSAFAKVQVEGETAPILPAVQACMWTAVVNVFVREGPGASLYPEITAVETGMVFPVVGQSQDQQFWVVEIQPGQIGYVPKAENFGVVAGNCDPPVLQDPPAPATETPEPAQATPQCSDGIDNDGDGKIDFNAAAAVGDRQCTSPDDNDEANR